MEYIKSSKIPLDTVVTPPAYMRIEANTGPKHGVHPAAKAIPINMELSPLVTFLGLDNLLFKLINLILMIPIIFKPKTIINIPLILEKISLFLTNILPSRVAEEPIIMNTIVNPKTNAKVLTRAKALLLATSSSVTVPVIYII